MRCCRLDPSYNPAIIPPAPANIVNNGYLGTTRTQALNWIDTLQDLGQVDPTVTADTPSYAAFIQDGQRSFVAFNPTSQTIAVTFHDAQSGAVLAVLTVGAGQTVTQLGSGQLITDRLEDYQVPNSGTSLYLLSSNNQNSLGLQPGTAVPNPNGNPLDINSYVGTFADVPANPNASDAFPGNANSLTFVSSPINGTPIAGDSTEFQLFLDNLLTWSYNTPAPNATYGRQYGPGVVQNTSLGTPSFDIEISYQFNDSNDPTGANATFTDRVEWYTAKLQPNNQFVIYDTTVPDPTVSFSPLFNQANLVNQPFQPMIDGRVKVQIWGGATNATAGPKDFAISVNTIAEMARTSH